MNFLDTALSDTEIRQFENRIASKFILRNRGDITGTMNRDIAERIAARPPDFDPNPWQIGGIDSHPGNFIAAEILKNRYRDKGALALDVLQDPPDIPLRHLDDRAQSRQGSRHIARLFTNDLDTEVVLIVGQRDTVHVQYPATDRRQELKIELVVA